MNYIFDRERRKRIVLFGSSTPQCNSRKRFFALMRSLNASPKPEQKDQEEEERGDYR
jgi:hypothetical protein